MLTVSEAQSRLLDPVKPLPAESTPLAHAAGRWTLSDVIALRSQPSADLSAMDGYAIRFADMHGPWTMVGESAAGSAFDGTVGPGEAVRIYTGAVMPAGADTVVVQEDVARNGDTILVSADGPTAKGKHVRPAGSDFRQDQTIIDSGTRLSARHIALAALAGHGALPLPRFPRIAVVSTGSELVLPGQPLHKGQIPASNALMLRSMLAALPCETVDLGIIPDDFETLSACFRDLRSHDVIVTSGGASVGDHDLVKPALEAAGGMIDFWKIRMRPGKPLIAGNLGNALFLGLPGNPVSAFVTAQLFLLPLVRKLAGYPDPLPPFRAARLDSALEANGDRETYLRATVTGDIVTPLAFQDSAATLALSQANCLIRRAPGSEAASAGDTAEFMMIG